MTSAGVGFCEEYIYLSSSNGGVYQLYGTEDDWGTTPQPIAGGGYPSLFCAANRLTRTGDDALGYMVSCGPTFVATATYSNGTATDWDDIGGMYVEAVIAHGFSGDSLLFWVGQRFPDLFFERLRLGGVNGSAAEVSAVLADSTIIEGTMDFHDGDHGVMALRSTSDTTIISITGDGGATWQTVLSSTGADVHDVEFLDEHTIWAVGDQGSIRVSTDTGLTWQSMTPPTPLTLWSVDGYSADSVWIAGQNGLVFATGNGGVTWSAILSLPATVHEIQTLDGAIYGHTGNGTLYRYFAAGDPDGIEEPDLVIRGRDLIIPLMANETLNRCSVLSVTGAALVDRTGAGSISVAGFSPGLYVVVAETDQRHLVGRVLLVGE